MDELKKLREQLTGLLVKSDTIRLKYHGKMETMTSQEETEWTSIMDEADKTSSAIKNLERDNAMRGAASAVSNALGMGDGAENRDDKGAAGGEVKTAEQIKRQVFKRYILGGMKSLTTAEIQSMSPDDLKAYQSDNPAGGGFLVTPQELANEVLTLMKDLLFMRQHARVFPLARAESLGIPAIDTDPSDADWTSELATGNEETQLAFGKRELKPQPLAKMVKESNKLMRQVPDAEGHIMDRLAYKFAVTQEKAFLIGDGANKPVGVFTASALGISTARDTAAAAPNAIAADDLLNVLFALKAQYRAKARWILNRSVLKAVRKLKDSNGNYIWSTGLAPGGGFQGTPGTLLERPYDESEYAPGTITTGLYTAILGDFSKYYIADALDMQVQVLDQLFALTNQTGYVLRMESDGMPVLEEAFARLKQA